MIWLELRVTQGHRFSPEDEHATSGLIEETLDIPARDVFCEAESNFAWCYVLAEESARVDVSRLSFFEHELRRAFRGEVGRSLDDVQVIDPTEVERHIPEAVQRRGGFAENA